MPPCRCKIPPTFKELVVGVRNIPLCLFRQKAKLKVMSFMDLNRPVQILFLKKMRARILKNNGTPTCPPSYITKINSGLYIHSICVMLYKYYWLKNSFGLVHKAPNKSSQVCQLWPAFQDDVKPSTIVATLVPEEGQFSFSHRRQTDRRESSISSSLRRHLFQMLYKIATRTLPFLCADDRNVCIYMSVYTHTHKHTQAKE